MTKISETQESGNQKFTDMAKFTQMCNRGLCKLGDMEI